MSNAISFDNIRTKKKISDKFIIPAINFNNTPILNNAPVITTKVIIENNEEKQVVENKEITIESRIETNTSKPAEATQIVSKFSLLGLQKKKEAELVQKERLNQISKGPVKLIEYNNLLNHWNDFAKKMNQNGEKIMYTYMVLDIPKLEGNTIKLEFPNQSSKEDFTKRQGNLLAYLKENLENFEINFDITISEEIKQKFAFTPEEKFEKLKQINPAIDLMRKIFELELN